MNIETHWSSLKQIVFEEYLNDTILVESKYKVQHCQWYANNVGLGLSDIWGLHVIIISCRRMSLAGTNTFRSDLKHKFTSS